MKRSGFKVMMKLIGLVKPLIIYMILAIMMGFIGHLCATFISIFGGYALLNILKQQDYLNIILICIIIFAFLRGILRYGEQAMNHYIAFKLLALIRDRVFSALRKLAPAKLEGKDKGNLMSIITSDIELLEVFYAHTISPIFIALLFSLFMVLFIGQYSYILALIAFIAYITIGIIIPMLVSYISGNHGLLYREKAGHLTSFILDSLRGLFEILQYGQGRQRLNTLLKQTDYLSLEEKHLKKIAGINNALTNISILFFDFLMLFISISISSFEASLICTIALMSSFGPVTSLAALGSTLQNTFASGNRVLDLLEEQPVVHEVNNQTDVVFNNASLNKISFSYNQEPILKELSLDIKKNNIIGILGRSGSGKSTILKLLMRFYDVNKGDIKISNVDIKNINTHSLRNIESYVTQETHLFHDTIKNNLLIAKLDASDEQIIDACKKASIHDFIMSLKDGYDTLIGELGDTLSGGERQRIGLARAFLHDSSLMLLDEPTSNLDSLNEAIILKALQKVSQEKTIILVSHRQSTMSIADYIYTIDQGRMS